MHIKRSICLIIILPFMVFARVQVVELATIVNGIVKSAKQPEIFRSKYLLTALEQYGLDFKNKKSDTLITNIIMRITDNRDTIKKIDCPAKIKIFCRGNIITKILISPLIISPSMANFDLSAYAKANGSLLDLYKCGSENAGDQSIYAYKGSFENKGYYLFVDEMSCGSHGCAIKIKAYFSVEALEKDNDLTICK